MSETEGPQAPPTTHESVEALVTPTGPGFGQSVVLAGLLFAPAALLVLDGNLSVYDALLRFGCALAAAAVGTALIRTAMPRRIRIIPPEEEGGQPG